MEAQASFSSSAKQKTIVIAGEVYGLAGSGGRRYQECSADSTDLAAGVITRPISNQTTRLQGLDSAAKRSSKHMTQEPGSSREAETIMRQFLSRSMRFDKEQDTSIFSRIPMFKEYLWRRKDWHAGLAEAEITQLEQVLQVRFPVVFRAYLRVMGKTPGPIFYGSEVNPWHYQEYRKITEEFINASQARPFLTEQTVVFFYHEGYSICYIEAHGGYDTPVFGYFDGDAAPSTAAPTFMDFIEERIQVLEKFSSGRQF